jgi:hypothetical protein
MPIEWRQKPREYSNDSIDCLAAADAPEGTEIVADYGPVFGDRIVYVVAWRRKITAGEVVTSQPTVQLAVEGYAPTPQVAKATCERLMECFQQIAHDSPGMLQTLHSAAT